MEERREIALFFMFMAFCLYIFLLPATSQAAWEADNMRETIAPGYSTGAETYDVEGGEEGEAVEEPKPPAVEEDATIGESESEKPEFITVGFSESTIGYSVTIGSTGPAPSSAATNYGQFIPLGVATFICWQIGRWLYGVLLDAVR